jgi:hypothetical protein
MADEKRTSSPQWIDDEGPVLKPLKSKRGLLDEKRMQEAASSYGYFEFFANRHEKILAGHGIKPRLLTNKFHCFWITAARKTLSQPTVPGAKKGRHL